jgi:hypothetical protein
MKLILLRHGYKSKAIDTSFESEKNTLLIDLDIYSQYLG